MPLCDVLTAIRHGVTVAEAGDLLLPNAQFDLTTVVKHNNVRHVSWNATSPNGSSIIAGQDTIGVRQGLIQYHSSLYRINP